MNRKSYTQFINESKSNVDLIFDKLKAHAKNKKGFWVIIGQSPMKPTFHGPYEYHEDAEEKLVDLGAVPSKWYKYIEEIK